MSKEEDSDDDTQWVNTDESPFHSDYSGNMLSKQKGRNKDWNNCGERKGKRERETMMMMMMIYVYSNTISPTFLSACQNGLCADDAHSVLSWHSSGAKREKERENWLKNIQRNRRTRLALIKRRTRSRLTSTRHEHMQTSTVLVVVATTTLPFVQHRSQFEFLIGLITTNKQTSGRWLNDDGDTFYNCPDTSYTLRHIKQHSWLI